MTSTKILIIAVLCAVIAAVAWWLTPHYSEQDKAYYVSVFCTVRHDDSSRFEHDMRAVIEGGNSDYALKKTTYNPSLGDRIAASWQALPPADKQAAGQGNGRCQQIMTEQLAR